MSGAYFVSLDKYSYYWQNNQKETGKKYRSYRSVIKIQNCIRYTIYIFLKIKF